MEFNDLENVVLLPFNEKYWIYITSIFDSKDIYITFNGFLKVYEKSLVDNHLFDLRNLMIKIEGMLKQGVKKPYKNPMIIFYYLYNEIVPKEFRSSNYDNFIKKYQENIASISFENLIAHLILDKNIKWTLDEIINVNEEYHKNKFKKNKFNIPTFLEVNVFIYIANEFLKEKNYDNHKLWLNKSILELSGNINSQNLLKKHIQEHLEVDINKFNELLLKGEEYV